jgi:threonine/homoserine/homoserine lactone efflux protein
MFLSNCPVLNRKSLLSRYILIVEKRGFREEFNSQGGIAMSFGIYLVGYIILIAGLAIGANLLHVPMQWIGVGILCLIGVAIVHGVTATRQKDPQS